MACISSPGRAGSTRLGLDMVTCVAAGPTPQHDVLGTCDWVVDVMMHAMCQQAQPLCSQTQAIRTAPLSARSLWALLEACHARGGVA